MDNEVDNGPFLKALSGADPIQARRFAAAKALELGWGGVSKVSAITGFSRTTINKGIQELESNEELKPPERLRKPGGGRKRVADREPNLFSHENVSKYIDFHLACMSRRIMRVL